MDYKNEIIKELEEVTRYGHNRNEVFKDWIALTLSSLESIPGRLKSNSSGSEYKDTAETEKLFNKAKEKYKKSGPDNYMDHFAAAMATLLLSTERYQDVLGQVYMDFGIPNNYTGQFFTPWEIAALNAEIGLPNIEEQLIDRIKAASKNKPELVIAGIEGALSAALGQKDNYFINKFLPMVAPLIEPIKIYDPCCGSGTMLLAAASKIPTWAHQFNLVGFYGQDLDITCVMMAKINMMIYGLNGFGLALEINAHMGKITKNEEGGFSTTISEPFGKDMIQLPLMGFGQIQPKVFANSET